MNSAQLPAHPKPPAIAPKRCPVKGCSARIAIGDMFCLHHEAMIPLDLAAQVFVAWEDFEIAANAVNAAEAHAALSVWLAAQRRARLAIEALEAGHAAQC